MKGAKFKQFVAVIIVVIHFRQELALLVQGVVISLR